MSEEITVQRRLPNLEDVGSGGVIRQPIGELGFPFDESEGTSPWYRSLTLAVLIGLTGGTGAHVQAFAGKPLRPTTFPERVRGTGSHYYEDTTTTPYTVEQLGDLRSVFGLNVSELAAILRVQRPTVYQWLKGGALRPKNAKRLGELHNLAVKYRDKGLGSVARYLHAPVNDLPSLIELLVADSLDTAAVVAVLERLLERQSRKAQFRSRVSEAVEQHGFEDATKEEQDAHIEQATSSVS